jgi:hypothetical protein
VQARRSHDRTVPAASAALRAKEIFEPIVFFGEIEIVGFGPHMHGYGRKMTATLSDPGGDEAVIARTDRWDFDWQKIYHYEEYPVMKPNSVLTVTCDYDTRSAKEPVQAGWGTRNEMCLPMMIVTLPPGVFL